ncbi:MAG: hypothetical protein FJW22_01775 [Acidimicrobiia bacterium]|nr:hypothetical protein [Acidimicrobiia bacterium]
MASISKRRVFTAATAVAAAIFAIPAIRHWRERPPEPPPPSETLRSAWLPQDGLVPGAGGDYSFGLALAPDGRTLIYPAATGGRIALYLHDLRTGDTRALPGTNDAAMPFWSPDASHIGFVANGKLRALDLATGQTSELADAAAGRGATWGPAGDILFTPAATGGVMKRAVDGSIAAFTTVDASGGETSHAWPAFLPDGRHAIFLVTAAEPSRRGIWIAPLDNPAARRRIAAADAQALVVDHVLLYLRDLTLMAQPLDAATLDPNGRAEVVGMNAGRGPLGQIFATASSDVLIYGAPGTTLRQLQWVTRTGEAAGSPTEPIDAWDLRIAPDGRRVAVTERDRQLRTLDVFVRTTTQPAPVRMSLSTDVDDSGVWSPDGLRVAWAGQRRKVLIRGAGAVLPEQTIGTFDTPVQVWDWSRDGRSLIIGRRQNDTGDDLWILPPVEHSDARPYAVAPFDQVYAAVSPDGARLAYASNESGQFDIYVDSYPTPGRRVRVTTAGATEPRWSADGRELYFRRGADIHALTLDRSEVRSSGRLFNAGAVIRAYDVSRDGRFLLNLPAANSPAAAATLIYQWQP